MRQSDLVERIPDTAICYFPLYGKRQHHQTYHHGPSSPTGAHPSHAGVSNNIKLSSPRSLQQLSSGGKTPLTSPKGGSAGDGSKGDHRHSNPGSPKAGLHIIENEGGDDDDLSTSNSTLPPEVIQKELACIEEMRAALKMKRPVDEQDAIAEDLTLRRFLRARRYDIPKAIDQYNEMKEWRKEHKVDTILDTPDPNELVFQCVCPHRNHGYDYEGHPVYFERTGLVRMTSLLSHMTEDEVVGRHIRHMEYVLQRCLYSSWKRGENVEKCVMIQDLAGMKFSIELAGQRCFRRTIHIDQTYYPERLHKIFIINAPLSFRGLWKMIKPWIDERTVKKIEILGGNYKERLLQCIPRESIPIMYGGTCACRYPNGDTCLPDVRSFPPQGEPPEPWPKIL